MGAQSLSAAAGALRHFNRFYTAQIGLLDRGLLGSPHSLTEARVLYELATRETVTAGALAKSLSIDTGYLSRMVAAFERQGLVERRRSAQDRRVHHLVLTENGRRSFARLDGLSQRSAEAMLARLPGDARRKLLDALRLIETALEPPIPTNGKAVSKSTDEIRVRPHRTGDMGWIVHRQSVLYAEEYGWDNSYEALISEITAQFIRDFKPGREFCWIAERDGEVVGSVFLVSAGETVAKLRLLYVEPSARGSGLGRRLVDECIAFARAKGYQRLDLWTNDILIAARKIYQATGFQLVHEEPHHSFGHDLIGQTWSLVLSE